MKVARPHGNGGFRQAALSGARWTLAAKIGLQLFTWPMTILVIRLLEPGDYGLLAMAMLTIGFVALFGEMGLGVALVQVDTLDEAVARAACAAILVCSIVHGWRIVLLAPLAADCVRRARSDQRDEGADVGAVDLFCGGGAASAVGAPTAIQLVSIAAIGPGVAGAVATLVFALAWLWRLGLGPRNARRRARSYRADRGLQRSRGLAVVAQRLADPGLIRFSGHVLAGRTLWYWYGQSDQVILARLLHASTLGYYTVAAQLAMLPASKAMEVINRVTFPVLSRMRSEQVDGVRPCI